MSCNGCRVLRKGCSENCSIRPCLQWIKSPESQANATVFLAKFYGRAGLLNLINAGPEHIRPAIFRSLLYEACGRIVNPIYGSVGLLWSGQWHHCQTAVEAVLKGAPITPISVDAAAKAPPVKGYDIRHVTKDENSGSSCAESNRLKPTRTRFKRAGSGKRRKASTSGAAASAMLMMSAVPELTRHDPAEMHGSSTSHDSSVSHPDETTTDVSMVSAETADADVEGRENDGSGDGELELELELTLGFGFGVDPVQKGHRSSEQLRQTPTLVGDDGACEIQLGLV